MSNAYDYDRQRWVDGSEGAALLRQQARQDLELLRSAKGAEYAHWLGVDRFQMIHAARSVLADTAN